MTAPTSPPAPPAPRRRLAWLLFGFALLAGVALLWYAATSRRSAGRLDRLLAELDRDDPHWRFTDLEAHRATVPDPENSALVVSASGGLLPRNWPPEPFCKAFESLEPNEELDPSQARLLAAEMDSVRPAVAEARRLADMPRGRYALTLRPNPLAILLPDQQKARTVSVLLHFDALRLAHEDRPREALASCRAALNAARSVGDEPFVVSFFIRTGALPESAQATAEVLGRTQPADADLAALQRAFQEEADFNALHCALRGDRATTNQLFEEVAAGRLSAIEAMQFAGADRGTALLAWAARSGGAGERGLMLDLTTRRVRTSLLPDHEQVAAEKALDTELHDLPRQLVLTRTLLPDLRHLGERHRRKGAALRCLVALLASERYRVAKGSWPTTLADLVPAYLKEVPADPFDGKPLRLKREPDGIIVYSVGPDGTDDGGSISRHKAGPPGSDIGYRLWDVPHRRKPRAAPRPGSSEP